MLDEGCLICRTIREKGFWLNFVRFFKKFLLIVFFSLFIDVLYEAEYYITLIYLFVEISRLFVVFLRLFGLISVGIICNLGIYL